MVKAPGGQGQPAGWQDLGTDSPHVFLYASPPSLSSRVMDLWWQNIVGQNLGRSVQNLVSSSVKHK